ncbi:MAG: dolichyl-phosphate beta-glucosyltransferase [Woeseia sp.]
MGTIDIELSIVIPAYNEAKRLPDTLFTLYEWIECQKEIIEVIVVDNASTDDTIAVASHHLNRFENGKVIRCSKRGKGYAVQRGVLECSGQHVLFMDADGSAQPSQIPKIRNALNEDVKIVIGSRTGMDGCCVERSLARALGGKLFSKASAKLIGVNANDPMCGFKIFDKSVIQKIFPYQKIGGWAFDLEILFIAGHQNIGVKEMPIDWKEQPGTKVGLWLDPIVMLIDVLRIPFLHRKTKFQKSGSELNE